MSTEVEPALKVSAHVLVQLGTELVTDAEQAILECVKNAYDADSPGCRIEIETREIGEVIEQGAASKLLRFHEPAESVSVAIFAMNGDRLDLMRGSERKVDPREVVSRHLHYTGRITIEDHGDGLSPRKITDSWLVVSRSAKRETNKGPKKKTAKNRTPLGDKGLGRLGSMKLGDILVVESATSSKAPLARAQFRWKDCDTAPTVEQVPVHTESIANNEGFKGTRVSVLGLKDMPEWRRKDRVLQIAKSLARLVSPFEATSTFPVSINLDGHEESLASITNQVLSRAVADFRFRWERDEVTDKMNLVATARFKKRLFGSARSEKQKEKVELAFKHDDGAGFLNFLNTYPRAKKYGKQQPSGAWFLELTRTFSWTEMLFDDGTSIADPGPFNGAFYFFHLDALDEPDGAAAAGLGIEATQIKEMAGISLLRDGFRVRAQGDWLGISSGMTTGSTYGMRVGNTVGYFALTGQENYSLVEKSDREGFVEDSAYRGFFRIATACKNFANDSLEDARRSLDDYFKKRQKELGAVGPRTMSQSHRAVEEAIAKASAASSSAKESADRLRADLGELESSMSRTKASSPAAAAALRLAHRAVSAVDAVQRTLGTDPRALAGLKLIEQERIDSREQSIALFESAAVGLSARGLAHELRTHLGAIKQALGAMQKLAKSGVATEANLAPHFRDIRGSCAAISNAASLIDPMLPRARTVKDTFELIEFIEDYVKRRKGTFEREEIAVNCVEAWHGVTVRINRSRLLQVLDNLVRNSVYWLNRGRMTKEVTRPKAIHIEVTSSGFSVADSGFGVDPRFEDSLFEMFVTAKPDRDQGQGLGLFIATQLVEMDGGELLLDAERNPEGRRYRFSVDLRSSLVKAGS